jgi:hypothetical protein
VKKKIGSEELLELVQQEAADDPRSRHVTVRAVIRVSGAGGANWTAVIHGAAPNSESANAVESILSRLGAEYELA